MHRLAIGFGRCEQKVGIVGKLRGSGAQLVQRGVSLSRIPKSGSQPALGKLVGGVLKNRCAEVIQRQRRPVQFYVIDPQKRSTPRMPGTNLPAAARARAESSNFA